MAYKSANDGIEFESAKELVQHMIDKYNSPFLTGDEKLIKLSKQVALTYKDSNPSKFQKLKEKFESEGLDI